MRVRVQPTGVEKLDGCGYARLQLPADALIAQGADVVCDRKPLIVHGTKTALYPKGRPDMVEVDADVLVLQRTMAREVLDVIPLIQRQGTAVVVEIDDDFDRLPAGHPARRLTAVANNLTQNRRVLHEACQIADLVTVSTPALAARYGAHGRVAVLPNLIPAAYLQINEPRTGYRLGWTGTTASHVDDLREVGHGVVQSLIDTGSMFRCVGTGLGVAEQLELGSRALDVTGWTTLQRYPYEYATLDAAIAPLRACEFNEAKSWLKVLEAAALGVPVVASPTSEYVRAAELGLCWIARDPGQWRQACTALMGSEQLRADIAGTARLVASAMTYEQHCGRWMDAWAQALANRREKAAA